MAKQAVLLNGVDGDEPVRKALRDWRDHLNLVRDPCPGKRPRYKPHSQHLFVVFAVGVELHKAKHERLTKKKILTVFQDKQSRRNRQRRR